ncbi:hypothetical protein [Actinomyces lilanjuaniae]|uniref:hypothetical protein n=1 Tax=Actinomyces lilanjuaniae TaxID=2321394 RepID=UPI001FA9A0D2|nr:hypothetical protein [Actinomyces lilanjuaniae]
MEGDFDLVGFGIHVGRCMLRAARDGGILVFALRAPGTPSRTTCCPFPLRLTTTR